MSWPSFLNPRRQSRPRRSQIIIILAVALKISVHGKLAIIYSAPERNWILYSFSVLDRYAINVNFPKPSGTLERRCSRGVTLINPVAGLFWISSWIVRESIRLQNNEGTGGSHQHAIRAAIVREAHCRDSERGGRVPQDPGAVPKFG